MATPTGGVYAALYTALTTSGVAALAGVSVWEEMVLEGTVPPYIVLHKMADPIDRTYRKRIFKGVYLVKAIVQSEARDAADDLDSAIDGILEGATLTVAGFTSLTCERTGGVSLREVVGGWPFWHVGGLWAIWQSE